MALEDFIKHLWFLVLIIIGGLTRRVIYIYTYIYIYIERERERDREREREREREKERERERGKFKCELIFHCEREDH